MNHAARVELAQALTQRIRAKYGMDVLGVAVYGSVARNEDSEHSDLEMQVVTTNAVAESDVEYVHTSDVKVEINYYPEDTYLARAGALGDEWWLSAGQYRNQLITYQRDDSDVFARAAAAADAVMQDEAQFKTLMARLMVDELYELMGKIRAAWQRRNEENLRSLGQYFVYCVCCYLALENRVYYTTSSTVWQQVRQFPTLPPGFEDELVLLAGFTVGSPAAVYRAAEELWANVQQLAATAGIIWMSDEWQV